MIIECKNCSRKFVAKANDIPESGRLVQCGNCSNKWFFDNSKSNIQTLDEISIKEQEIEIPKTNISTKFSDNKNKTIKKKLRNTKEINKIKNKKIKKNIIENKFKKLIVIIITLFALIVLADTFKTYLSVMFPKLEPILNNLHETLFDIYLFIRDLTK